MFLLTHRRQDNWNWYINVVDYIDPQFRIKRVWFFYWSWRMYIQQKFVWFGEILQAYHTGKHLLNLSEYPKMYAKGNWRWSPLTHFVFLTLIILTPFADLIQAKHQEHPLLSNIWNSEAQQQANSSRALLAIFEKGGSQYCQRLNILVSSVCTIHKDKIRFSLLESTPTATSRSQLASGTAHD